jgi:hypothetical protein
MRKHEGTMSVVSTRPGRVPGLSLGLSLVIAASSCGGGEVAAEEDGPSGFARPERAQQEGTEPARLAEAPVSEPPPESGPAEPEAPVEIATPVPATSRAAERAGREQRARAHLEAGESEAAARAYSDLLLAEVNGDQPADRAALARWAEALGRAQARHRWYARGGWASVEARVHPGDSLIALRKRVLAEHTDLRICTGLIARANQLRSETSIRPDDTLRVPTDEADVLVDLSARWAFYRLGGEVAAAWEVGIGKDESETTPGVYTIGTKQKNPPWFPPGRDMVAYGDPENPLGTRWLAWNDENGRTTSLGFHGTSDESGVGQRVSRGCIRMRNADVEELFEILPQGSTVVVQP